MLGVQTEGQWEHHRAGSRQHGHRHMRTLRAHSVHLVAVFLLSSFLVCGAVGAVDRLPRPIGYLSDYGAVFDRHGRETVGAMIDEVRTRMGLEVYVLVTWENPLPDAAALARAVQSSWGLSSKLTLLAVFLKANGDWTSSVVAGAAAVQRWGAIDVRSMRRIADLVDHNRIEEAVASLLEGLLDSAPAADDAARSSGEPRGLAPGVSVALVVVGTIMAALFVHRRICPRCGGILHRETRSPHRAHSRSVYFCRRCGFRRETK